MFIEIDQESELGISGLEKTAPPDERLLRKMNMAPLENKPYVNEVTLNEQNLH